MSNSPTFSIGLVVEAAADEETTQLLVDRTLSTSVPWATEELLGSLRGWRGIEPETSVTYWKNVPELARQQGLSINTHGHFDGKPGAPDARAARRALLLFKRTGMPDAIILVRDADNQTRRLRGLQQARAEAANPERIAIGVARPEREAWILAGFEPLDQRERSALADQRRELGFDPTREPHRLGGHGKREAKAILGRLVHGDRERVSEILHTCSLETLEERGKRCGLTDFLEEVRDRVAVLLTR